MAPPGAYHHPHTMTDNGDSTNGHPEQFDPEALIARFLDSIPEPDPKKLGQPTKYTPARIRTVIQYIRAGNYVETAALAAGIGVSTLHEWRAKHPDFAEAIQSARAIAEQRNVLLIQNAASESWQAAAWWLERSFPQKYGRHDRIEHTGADGGPIQVETIDALDAQIAELERELAARDG